MPEGFEDVARLYYESRDFLVSCNVKIPFDQTDKVARQHEREIAGLGASDPAIDIDLVAGNSTQLVIVEVKSWFKSTGLAFADGLAKNAATDKPIRLFSDEIFRNYVQTKLAAKYGYKVEQVSFALVVGKVAKGEKDLKRHFKAKGWELVTAKEVAERVHKIASQSAYIDHPAIAMVRCLGAGGF
jgi:hypothetical protein